MKTNWGLFIVDGRGKLGGHVAQKGHYGTILRTKTTPVNRNTVFQQGRRISIAELTKEWSTLTDDQRKGWNNAAEENPVTDIFGKSMNLTGINMFCSANLNFDLVGLPRSKSSRGERRAARRMYKGTVIAGDDIITIDSNIAIDAILKVAVFATGPLSPGLASGGSKYKNIDTLDETDTFPYDLTAAYVARFGPIVQEGEKIFVKLTQIEILSGIANSPITASAIITNTPPP